MKSKRMTIILVVLSLILIIVGSTFAYLSWQTSESEKTNVVFTVTSDFRCAADGGGNITPDDVTLIPTTVSSSTTGNYIKREVKVTPTITKSGKTIYLDLWLDIKDIGTGLTNSDNFMYAFTTNSTSNTLGVISSGNFKGKTTGDKINLLNVKDYTSTTVDTYYLWIWLDAKETSSETMNQTFSLSLNGSCADKLLLNAQKLIEKANPSTLTYTEATDTEKGEMWTFSHEATEQTEALTDYRYIGNVPNNYITYNNEVWRMIGVFDGRIKIIKDASIGSMYFDYKTHAVGSSTGDSGSNDWTDSQLMYMLNPTTYKLKTGYTLDGNYIKDANGYIMYQIGCRPASIAVRATAYSCKKNTWTLNNEALSQIDEVTYYLGGTNNTTKGASDWYTVERGTTVPTNRELNWDGYVGLMYPSDYSYTFANGVDDTCYNNMNVCYTDRGAKPSNSWLFNSSNSRFTISPFSSYIHTVFFVGSNGRVGTNYPADYRVDNVYGVQPVVYLKQNIKLEGTGTRSNPYTIA